MVINHYENKNNTIQGVSNKKKHITVNRHLNNLNKL